MDDKLRILEQVEFYFGDSNLHGDKFLRAETAKNDGWVEIATIAKFNRMKAFTDVSLIVEALRQSPALLEVNEEGTMVRRKVPLNVDEDALQARTIHVCGLAVDATLEALETYFATVGTVKCVRMLKERRKFNGEVYVEFATVEEAQAALLKSLVWNETPLTSTTKAMHLRVKEFPKIALDNVVTFSNAPAGMEWKALRELLETEYKQDVELVWMNKDDATSGCIEFKQPNASAFLEQIAAKPVVLNDTTLTVQLPTDEQRESYWKNHPSTFRQGNKRKHNNPSNRNNKRR
jgi:hypothetical protein